MCDTLLLTKFFGVPRITRGGGLAIFWKQDFDLQVGNSSPNFIDTIINRGKDDVWWFISFYGALETSRHSESWNLPGLNIIRMELSFGNVWTKPWVWKNGSAYF